MNRDAETAVPARAPAAAGAALAPDVLAGGRYRVICLLGAGGMGEVYEAVDSELHERVALKAVKPEVAADEAVRARFLREIQLARKVTHPHVCRIFDVGHHGEVTFLTMELLRGETLLDRIRRGRLSPAEALPIVRAVVAGLAAAHEADVVHRDFKPGNVILAGERPVITDFGLARGPGGGDPFGVVTTRSLYGSPAYMAPEQLDGRAVTPATDLYALGVTLFQMVTGKLPFEGDDPIAVAAARLARPAPSARVHVPDLDARWEATIARCLERDPTRRFAAVGDVIEAIEGRARARRRRVWPWLAAGLALAVAGAIAVVVARKPVDARPVVAILELANLGARAEDTWVATAITHMLEADLGAAGDVRLAAAETVASARRDLKIAGVDSLGAETLRALGERTGARLVVGGSVLVSGDRVDLVVRVQDAASGELLASGTRKGRAGDVADLASEGARAVRDRLGWRSPTDEQLGAARTALPRDARAARAFVEGLSLSERGMWVAARALFEQAAEIEPGSPVIWQALADLYGDLGDARREVEAARRAVELSKDAPEDARLLAEMTFNEIQGLWPAALERSRKLFERYPDNPRYGTHVMMAQFQTHDVAGARRTAETISRLPFPAGETPGFLLTLVNVEPDPERKRVAAQRARLEVERAGSRLDMAQMKLTDAEQLSAIGDLYTAEIVGRQARELFQALGAPNYEVGALALVARARRDLGDLAGALALYDETAALSRRSGVTYFEFQSLQRSGQLLFEAGRSADARARTEEALRLTSDDCSIPSHLCRSDVEVLQARIALADGDLDGAERLARAAAGRPGARSAGAASIVLCSVQLARGQLAEARATWDAARVTQEPEQLRRDLAGGRLLVAEGHLPEALALIDRGRHTALRNRFYGLELEARLALGEVQLAAKDPAAKTTLTALVDEAGPRGWRGVADRAKAILR